MTGEGAGPGEVAAREEVKWNEGERAGWSAALEWMITIINAELAAIAPYADTRPLESLRGQAEDKMRSINDGGDSG